MAVRKILLWQQIGCIVVFAKKLKILYEKAFDIFIAMILVSVFL